MSINNKGLFKNDDARRMLRNMGGVKRPTGILASSQTLMDAVAMPRKQTGQGKINSRALAGQFGTTVNSPTTMNRNAMSAPMDQMQPQPQMAMAQGPVAGMPSVQTEYNMGGPVQGYALGGLARVGSAIAPVAGKILSPMKQLSGKGPGRTITLDGGALDVAKKAGTVLGGAEKSFTTNSVIKGSSWKKLGIIGAATLANESIGNPFSVADYGEDADGLNKELQDTFDIAKAAGDTEGGAREFITQLGGNPEGNVKDELNKIYKGVSGKNIPPSKKDRVEGSIKAIVGAATMAAKGNDMQRIAAGLGAGAVQRLAMEKAAAGAKKTSAYTPERLYQQSIDAILRGPEENIPMKNSGRIDSKDNPIMEPDYERVKSIARSLAGMDGSTSSSASTPEAALKTDPSPEMIAMYDQKYGKGSAAKVLGG